MSLAEVLYGKNYGLKIGRKVYLPTDKNRSKFISVVRQIKSHL